MPGRASAGNTSRRCEPVRLSLACSGSSEASRRFLNCQIGARSSNIPFFDLLAGCTPPPVNDSSEAATRSAGRIPRSLGTIVGWSRATTVQAVKCLRSSMYLRACSKRTSTGGSNETSPTSSKMSAQIAPGLLSDQAESKPKMIVSVCRVVTLGAKPSSSVGRSENRPILRQAGRDCENPWFVGIPASRRRNPRFRAISAPTTPQISSCEEMRCDVVFREDEDTPTSLIGQTDHPRASPGGPRAGALSAAPGRLLLR